MEREPLLNRYLDERAARDIDSRVGKVLRDLGDPEPPLRLEQVREILDLDRAYYSSGDDGILRETVHRLKMAGKQVIRRPALLLDVVRKLDLKALWIPDRKRILLDEELPSAKQRWAEAHEIGHSLLPWHELVMHGDQSRTLSYASQQQLESEANFAAGRMLFLQDGFLQHVENADFNFNWVREISKRFGNTMTSTLWRCVESTGKAAFGLVSQHPQHPDGTDSNVVRYFIRSRAFEAHFQQTTANDIFKRLRTFCFGRRGPIGSDKQVIRDIDGEEHVFFIETFFNSYHALTLGVHHGKRPHSVYVTDVLRCSRV